MAEITVVLITGVNKGLGLGMAQIYLNRPNHVVIGSVRDESSSGVAELKSKTPAEGTKLLFVHIESTSHEDPKKAVAAVEAAGVDHVDIIIANAGGTPWPIQPIETVSNQDLVWAFQTNTAGPLGLFQAFRHLLQKSKSPRWASISSLSGSIGRLGITKSYIVPAYSISKAAQNYMTQALGYSQEWLTAISIDPGHSQTDPGNWIAKEVGMEKAPLTVEECVNAIIKTVETTSREEALGKCIYVMDGTVQPW